MTGRRGEGVNVLDRIIRRERRQRFRRLKKLFKARDMATKYLNKTVKISDLDRYIRKDEHNHYFTGDLAKRIVDEHRCILGIRVRPPKPPSQKQKGVII